jgi:hypothetical protein
MTFIYERARSAFLIAMIVMLVELQTAAAHAGHAHGDAGLSRTTMLGVAGVMLALGVAWRLTSLLSHTQDVPGDDEEPALD